MAYCAKCGVQLADDSNYCQQCGTPSNPEPTNNSSYDYNNSEYNPYTKSPTETLAQREQISAIIWCIIACVQGLTGLSVTGGLMWLGELIGFDLSWSSLFTLGLAAFNGYGAYCSFQRVKRVRLRQRGIVAEYDGILTMSIVAIVANILLGSVIGIAGAVFDLFNRNYALSNAKFLEN